MPGRQCQGSEPALLSPAAVVWGAGLGEARTNTIQKAEGGGGEELRREVRNSSSGKKKPVWKIQTSKYQKEGKGYLECAGEHETGVDSVGKETEKSTRE